jgi:hypothetical protein
MKARYLHGSSTCVKTIEIENGGTRSGPLSPQNCRERNTIRMDVVGNVVGRGDQNRFFRFLANS